MILLFFACAPETEEYEPGFEVTGVSPEDGAADVVEAKIPELHLSYPASSAACTPDTLRLDGVHDDGTVAFSVDIDVVAQDQGFRLQLTHVDPLPRGWTYAISARAGDTDGCVDTDGRALRPFASTFTVP